MFRSLFLEAFVSQLTWELGIEPGTSAGVISAPNDWATFLAPMWTSSGSYLSTCPFLIPLHILLWRVWRGKRVNMFRIFASTWDECRSDPWNCLWNERGKERRELWGEQASMCWRNIRQTNSNELEAKGDSSALQLRLRWWFHELSQFWLKISLAKSCSLGGALMASCTSWVPNGTQLWSKVAPADSTLFH